MKTSNQKITQCLWFDNQGAEATEFYASVFENVNINKKAHYSEAGQEIHGQEPGSVMTVEFEIEGKTFMALNGGPIFKKNPSISFFVNCETEAEVDRLWQKLSDGGKALMPLDKYDYSDKYGWIEDRYGVSWQIILSKPDGEMRPKIIPCLLFTNEKSGKTKEAIDFYISVFADAKIGLLAPNETPARPAGGPGAKGTTAFADFMLQNQWFAAMDSPYDSDFGFNEAISFVVHCENQEEIDYFWGKLSAVPESEVCGWLKDKFGVSWQIVPKNINELIKSPNAMEAMMQMKKLDIAKLLEAGKD